MVLRVPSLLPRQRRPHDRFRVAHSAEARAGRACVGAAGRAAVNHARPGVLKPGPSRRAHRLPGRPALRLILRDPDAEHPDRPAEIWARASSITTGSRAGITRSRARPNNSARGPSGGVGAWTENPRVVLTSREMRPLIRQRVITLTSSIAEDISISVSTFRASTDPAQSRTPNGPNRARGRRRSSRLNCARAVIHGRR